MRGGILVAQVACLIVPLLGCGKRDEVVVRQRRSAALPALGGLVKVRVGDIKRGQTADVEIIGPDSGVLASKQGAQVGDRIPFAHDGKQYDVEVIHYHDEVVGNDDFATFRLIPR